MVNMNKQFIEHVKLYRQDTGCLLKDAIKHVERLIFSGAVDFSKYEDPNIVSINVKPALKLLVGDVIYIGYEEEYSGIVSSVNIDGKERKISVSFSLHDKTEKQVSFSFEDFARLTPFPKI